MGAKEITYGTLNSRNLWQFFSKRVCVCVCVCVCGQALYKTNLWDNTIFHHVWLGLFATISYETPF